MCRMRSRRIEGPTQGASPAYRPPRSRPSCATASAGILDRWVKRSSEREAQGERHIRLLAPLVIPGDAALPETQGKAHPVIDGACLSTSVNSVHTTAPPSVHSLQLPQLDFLDDVAWPLGQHEARAGILGKDVFARIAQIDSCPNVARLPPGRRQDRRIF